MIFISYFLNPTWDYLTGFVSTDKVSTGLQFIKYGFCGLAALAIDMVIFFLLACFLWPALTQDDLLVRLLNITIEQIPESSRSLNFCIGNITAFILSNFAAYILNILFVFETGRHNRLKEIVLFYLSSAASVAIGIGLGVFLIDQFNLSTTSSYTVKAITSTLINYIFRKTFVFKG